MLKKESLHSFSLHTRGSVFTWIEHFNMA